MKKILLVLSFTLFSTIVYAQSSYKTALEEKAKKISIAKSINDYDKLLKEFADQKKSQDPYKWKAYYYSSLVLYKKAEFILKNNKNGDLRELNGLAEKNVLGGLTVEPNDKESLDLLKLIEEQRQNL